MFLLLCGWVGGRWFFTYKTTIVCEGWRSLFLVRDRGTGTATVLVPSLLVPISVQKWEETRSRKLACTSLVIIWVRILPSKRFLTLRFLSKKKVLALCFFIHRGSWKPLELGLCAKITMGKSHFVWPVFMITPLTSNKYIVLFVRANQFPIQNWKFLFSDLYGVLLGSHTNGIGHLDLHILTNWDPCSIWTIWVTNDGTRQFRRYCEFANVSNIQKPFPFFFFNQTVTVLTQRIFFSNKFWPGD